MFVIDIPYFSVMQTFYSRQSLLWTRHDRHADHVRYTVQHDDMLLGVAQHGNRVLFNCSEDDFFNIWFHYFDLGCDYCQINNYMVSLRGYMQKCAEYSTGVHTIHTNPHEAILYAILTHKQYYSESKRLMRWLCENFGEKRRKLIKGLGSVEYSTIPTPEQIYEKIYLIGENFLNIEEWDSTEQQLLNFGTMNLIYSYVQDCINGVFDANNYLLQSDESLHLALRMYDWLPTEREACRVMLYGYGRKDVFPKTKRIASDIEKNTMFDFETFLDWYLSDTKYKGVAYNYLMYKSLNPIERRDRWAW